MKIRSLATIYSHLTKNSETEPLTDKVELSQAMLSVSKLFSTLLIMFPKTKLTGSLSHLVGLMASSILSS